VDNELSNTRMNDASVTTNNTSACRVQINYPDKDICVIISGKEGMHFDEIPAQQNQTSEPEIHDVNLIEKNR